MKKPFIPLLKSIAALSLINSASTAESITLKNGNTLSGSLLDSNKLGVLSLKHPQAEQPLKIKEDAIKNVLFDYEPLQTSKYNHFIYLRNGDKFPCEITNLNDQKVTLNSRFLSNSDINREHIEKIKFNINSNTIIYSGPANKKHAWKLGKWKLKKNKLVTSQQGSTYLKLPKSTDNYVLKINLKWNSISPNLRIYFSADAAQPVKIRNGYYLDLNSHGITTNRMTARSNVLLRKSRLSSKSKNLDQIHNTGGLYINSQINLEIYVDSKQKKMNIFLNGKFVKTINDPIPRPIKAASEKYLIFNNNDNKYIEINKIDIKSWKGKIDTKIATKENILKKHDIITDLSGNIISAKILNSFQAENASNLTFKAPFATNDSTIPHSSIDTLEFKTLDIKATETNNKFVSDLISGGRISFSKSQLIDGKINFNHFFLGDISIPKDKIISINAAPLKSVEVKVN